MYVNSYNTYLNDFEFPTKDEMNRVLSVEWKLQIPVSKSYYRFQWKVFVGDIRFGICAIAVLTSKAGRDK